MRRKLLYVAALVIGGSVGWLHATSLMAPPPPTHNVVTVHDGDPVPDMTHGQYLNIIMALTDDKVSECYDMGGVPLAQPDDSLLICTGVDF